MDKSLPFIGTQVFCCLDVTSVNFGKRSINWQKHKRQKVVNQSENDCSFCIKQLLSRKAKPLQQLIDWAGCIQKSPPGIGAEQKILPHRQQKQEVDNAANTGFELPKE